MTVHAIAVAPSRIARSAAGVTQCAANSGWWLPAGAESMSIVGWIAGMAREIFAMSVDAVRGRSGGGGKTRPSDSALAR